MADEIDVVVEVSHKVVADALGSAPRVADELALGHLVLHVRAGQVDGQQDQRVAQDVDGVYGAERRTVGGWRHQANHNFRRSTTRSQLSATHLQASHKRASLLTSGL